MIKRRIRILFLCSVLLASGSVCKAREVGYSYYNSLKNRLILPKTSELNYSDAHRLKSPGIGSNTMQVSSIWQKKSDMLIQSEGNLKSKNKLNENNNILGMYIMSGIGKLRYNLDGAPLYSFDYEYIKGGGISLEIPLLTLNEKFSVYNELGFSQFKANTNKHYSDTVGGDPQNNYYDINLTFAPNTITLSNLVKYTLTPGNFKYYLALGIYNSFVVSSTNLKETVHVANGESDTYIEDAVPDPSVYGLMVLFSTGFSYKNIGLEFRFDPGHNYSNKLNYAVYMPNIMAVLHVTFNKE